MNISISGLGFKLDTFLDKVKWHFHSIIYIQSISFRIGNAFCPTISLENCSYPTQFRKLKIVTLKYNFHFDSLYFYVFVLFFIQRTASIKILCLLRSELCKIKISKPSVFPGWIFFQRRNRQCHYKSKNSDRILKEFSPEMKFEG